MDIQEIREGVFDIVQNVDNLYPDEEEKVEAILSCLVEKGACFPIEGELPKNDWKIEDMKRGWDTAQREILKVGYKKVITLKEMMGGDR